jgi:nicotinamide phosphoribosyltransferase
MPKINLATLTDVYKETHYRFIPPDTKYMWSYLESRGVTDKGVKPETLMYGTQILLKSYFEGIVIEEEDLQAAADLCKKIFGGFDYFNYDGWKKMYDKYGGKLPVEIRAVPEGTVVPSHNVLISVVNTDPEFPFIVNFLETVLLQMSWYPITVASQSFAIKKLINKWARETGGAENNPYHLNDFGFRGVSSTESAGIGGSAHLVNFDGTDTIRAIEYARYYYGYEPPMYGNSVPASEHSATIVWGEEHEVDAYRHFMEQYPEGLISIVSDSYDLRKAIEFFGTELKDLVVNRKGKLVVRPDSGYPPTVMVQTLKELEKYFGCEKNALGYKELPPYVGIIYGDFIRYGMIDDICEAAANAGYSTNNFVFGMGGALLQQVNRDTFKFAFKTSAVNRDGVWYDVSKHPAQDMGKKSKAGRLQLIKGEDGKFFTQKYNPLHEDKDVLQTVFRNGEIVKTTTFTEIRQRMQEYL